MKSRFVMDTDYLTGQPTDSAAMMRWLVATSPHRTLYVVQGENQLVGVVRLEQVPHGGGGPNLSDIMLPVSHIATIAPEDEVDTLIPVFRDHSDWSSVPVVENGKLLGIIPCELIVSGMPKEQYDSADLAIERLQHHILGAMYSGLIVVDGQGITRLLNPAGADILGINPAAVVNRPYEELAQYLFPHMRDYLEGSAVPLVLSGHAAQGERELRIRNGRTILFKFGSVREEERLMAILITFMDVSPLRTAQDLVNHQNRELEVAFGLTLPNSKVETKLKTSPEYQDIYDPKTDRATVTGVLSDGTYWHVINGLRIMGELKVLGVFQLVGIDKDTMVQAFIFHDIGKAQPHLELGETFVPKDTFEPGYLHAARSADWASKDYHVAPDVEWLVRYHHTAEGQLPPSFPKALLPMLRLFQLVDGLSAGMTRRQATIAPLRLYGSTLEIQETNIDARYHRHYTLSIYTGEEQDLSNQNRIGYDQK